MKANCLVSSSGWDLTNSSAASLSVPEMSPLIWAHSSSFWNRAIDIHSFQIDCIMEAVSINVIIYNWKYVYFNFCCYHHFSNIEICEKNRTLNTKSTHTQNGYGFFCIKYYLCWYKTTINMRTITSNMVHSIFVKVINFFI